MEPPKAKKLTLSVASEIDVNYKKQFKERYNIDVPENSLSKILQDEWVNAVISYCRQFDCTVYDLIEAHKAKKQPKVKITNLTENKNTNISFDTKK